MAPTAKPRKSLASVIPSLEDVEPVASKRLTRRIGRFHIFVRAAQLATITFGIAGYLVMRDSDSYGLFVLFGIPLAFVLSIVYELGKRR